MRTFIYQLKILYVSLWTPGENSCFYRINSKFLSMTVMNLNTLALNCLPISCLACSLSCCQSHTHPTLYPHCAPSHFSNKIHFQTSGFLDHAYFNCLGCSISPSILGELLLSSSHSISPLPTTPVKTSVFIQLQALELPVLFTCNSFVLDLG